MADEEIINQQADSNVIPDEVFEELEKIAELEKSVRFLQFRQGSVEKSVTELREIQNQKSETSEDPSNVISDTIEEDKKDEKNLVDENKLKPILTTVEKKRYENIGVEFIKGAQKVFDEIKKSEELKKKMSSKRIDSLNKKEETVDKKEEKKEKKGSLASMFLKLGLAITGIIVLLDTFKEKIDELIPGFEVNFDNFVDPIKGVGTKICDAIKTFLHSVLGKKIDDSFDTMNDGITKFFTVSLPNTIYQSGLTLVEAFGGKITDEMRNQNVGLQTTNEQHLLNGRRLAETNSSILNDPFAKERQLLDAQSKMGISALQTVASSQASVDANIITQFGRVLSNESLTAEQQRGLVTDNHASVLLSTMYNEGMLSDNKIDEGELRTIHRSLGITRNFDEWKNDENVRNFFGTDTVSESLNSAFRAFSQDIDRLGQRTVLQESFNQMLTTKRENALVVNNGEMQLNAEIKPIEIAQDAFVQQLSQVYESFKKAWGGDGLADSLLKSVQGVVEKVYTNFLEPIFDIIGNVLRAFTPPPTPSTQSGRNTSVGTNQPIAPITINAQGNKPVVVINFSMDAGVVTEAQNIVSAQNKLVQAMTTTNEHLRNIKSITVNTVQRDTQQNGGEIDVVKSDVNTLKTKEAELRNIVMKIEEYLEEIDDRTEVDYTVILPQSKSATQQ